jgi:hypothetical protein
MSCLEIEIRQDDGSAPEGPQGIALRADGTSFTRLLRPHEGEPDDFLRAPPAALAFWLVDNWWRIRWECIAPAGVTAEWRLAHEMSSIGGGYVWPRLAMWGEDGRVGLWSRSDPLGVVGPVRYLTDALLFVGAPEFEAVVDGFLSNAADAYTSAADGSALRAELAALSAERGDPDNSAWRRMEARLGFDPDEAPEATIERLARLAEQYGEPSVEEAAMAMPGVGAAEALEAEIEAAQGSRVECRFREAIRILEIVPAYDAHVTMDGALEGNEAVVGMSVQHLPLDDRRSDRNGRVPWKLAEDAARVLRAGLGLGNGPLRNKALAEVFGTTADNFRFSSAVSGKRLPYGLRLSTGDGDSQRIIVRSRWPHDRRFELARALGDAVWSGGDRLGPMAASKTARQKFQRAFAQSLLCPYDDLVDYIGTEQPADEDVSAAAQHFHVSERVVRSLLVNKGVLGRDRLDRFAREGLPSGTLDELVDAT